MDLYRKNKERAARRERLQLLAREWKDRKGLARLFGLTGWSSLFGFGGLAASKSLEQRYLRWSRTRAAVEVCLTVMVLGVIGESMYWAAARGLPLEVLTERWGYMLGKGLPLPELVEVPAGSFMMGSDHDEWSKPVHRVFFAAPFYLGRTEVTFEQWDACVADSGCNGYRPYDQGWGRELDYGWGREPDYGWGREPDYGWGREALPAINISWEDTQSYVVWLSRRRGVECRLPSEAEWEYAARAGTTTEYALPAPDGSNDIGASRTAPASKILANCSTCGGRFGSFRTAPVGRFPANAWGLHDMHGNVGEWVEDCLHKSYAGAPEDGRAWLKEGGDGDCPLRVVRSGSWAAPQDYARSATRSGYSPYHRDSTVGFRVACSSPINER